jgi:hypothetical protein
MHTLRAAAISGRHAATAKTPEVWSDITPTPGAADPHDPRDRIGPCWRALRAKALDCSPR